MAELKLTKLEKAYGQVKVLHGIDLHIEKGEFIVFVGPSGCGKSTLLRCIAGFEPVSGGQIRLHGEDIAPLPPFKRPAHIWQEADSLPRLGTQKIDRRTLRTKYAALHTGT